MEGHDFYRVLQVDPAASSEIIAEAYWALVRKAQSQRGHEASDGGRLNRLNVAYATLINPELRSSYDTTLEPRRTRRGSAQAPRGGQRRSLFGRLFRSGTARTATRNVENYYRMLHVDPEAEPEVIAAAYACLRRQLGEDLWQGSVDEETVSTLAEAFSVLQDPERRAEHDARLLGRREDEARADSLPVAIAEPAGEEEAESEPETSPQEDGVEVQPPEENVPRRRPLPLLAAFIGQAAVVAWRVAAYVAKRTGRGLRWLGRSVLVPTGRWLRSSVIAPAWRRLGDRLSGQLSAAPPANVADELDRTLAERLSPAGTAPLPVRAEIAPAVTDREQRTMPLASLIVQGGPHAGTAFIVTDRPISLGADPKCDVILDTMDDDVAPVQVRIWHRERRFMIHRIAGKGTTLVNERPITWGVLEDGDQLRIGHHQLTFALAEEGSARRNGQTTKAKGEVS